MTEAETNQAEALATASRVFYGRREQEQPECPKSDSGSHEWRCTGGNDDVGSYECAICGEECLT